ncbi:trypsin-like serine protease [Mariniblastus sp.]|nr:trypsin-like serine protease [Mariniblastus sp.]
MRTFICNRIKVLLALSLCVGFSLTLCSNLVGQVQPRITINDAAGEAAAISYGGDPQFNAVVALILASNGSGDSYCTGVLISPTTVLSARHCDIRTNEFVRFGPDSDNPTFSTGISSFSYPFGGNDNSPLLDGGDFAIITLDSPVPSSVATPLRLTDRTSSLVGEEVALIGYGGAGLGSVGGDSSNVLRWGSRNVIDQYGAAAESNSTGTNLISIDFDDGSAANNFTGSSVPLTLEGTVAQGDSGGPVLIQENGEWLVAGVLSGGTTPGGVYGDVSWWTGVEPFKAQIEAAGGVFADLLLGDVNLDGLVDFSDIAPFIVLLSSSGFQVEADLDQSGFVDFSDIAPFAQRLSGP